MAMAMDWIKNLKVALGVAVISWLLTWVYSFFKGGIANITFAAIDVNVGKQIASGLDTSLAGKLIGSMIGAVPAGLQTFILLFVSALAIVILGRWVNEQLGNQGKTPNTRFAFDLTIGAVLVGLVLGLISPSIGALGGVVALGIYFLIVAGVYSLLRNFGAQNFLPTP